MHGNQSISRSYTDRATKTITRVVDEPFSTQNAESVTVNGLLTSSTTSTGLTSTYGYDALGRRTSVTDPRTGTRLTNYNAKGQVEWTEDAAGNRTSYGYDPNTGRRVTMTTAEGTSIERTVQYQYDLKGQLEQVSGDTEPVDYGYDDYGRKTSMTTYRDSTGDTTTWVYEEATGLLLEKVYADGNKTTYTYTPEGQLLTRHWARGVDTTYTRDPASGEVTLIDYSDSTPDVSLSYDSRGRPQTISDGLGTRTLSYGTGSHLLADSLTGVTRTYTDGRLTGLTLGADYGMTYGYDTFGRFETLNAQIAGTGTQTYTYSYLQNSDLLESLTTSHGLVVTRAYEPNRDVLTQVQNQFGTNIISQYDYISDELAQRTSMTTSGLAFDTSPDPVIEPGTTDYTTNELNQYTTLTVGSNPAISLTYDLDGNLSNDGIHQFTYDAENRLTSMTPITPTAGSTRVEYAYDYMSRRTQKQVSTYDGSSWVLETEKSFVYDGWNLIQEQTTTGGSTTTDYYVWGLDVSGSLQGAGGIGGLLSKTNNLTSKIYLYTVDANGNVGQLVDASTGAIAAHYEYDPFGKLLVSTGSEAENNDFRFSTKYYDVETGLYYYGYRYYDPVLGRWRTRDPMEEEGFGLLLKQGTIDIKKLLGIYFSNNRDGGQQQLLLYSFVENDPIGMIDLYGLQSQCSSCGPNVSQQVDRTLQDIRNKYDSWGRSEKAAACDKIYDILDPTYGGYEMAWDIIPLHFIGNNTLAPSAIWPEVQDGKGGNSVEVNGAQCGDCEFTVQYYGKCHNAGYLNFIMWGAINQRCYETFGGVPLTTSGYAHSLDFALFAAKAWKTWWMRKNEASLPEVLAAVKAGYHASGAWPLDTSLYSHCAVDPSNRVSDVRPLGWIWEPIRHRHPGGPRLE